MARMAFLELLDSRPWLLADGATGTNYFQMGLSSGDAPEMWNFDHPDRVRSLHRSFIEAGADIVLTNSFGANRYRLKLHNAQDQARELNIAAARNARAEADAATRPVMVAGSMGPTGEIFQPVGTLAIEDGADCFAEQAQALRDGGADVLWIETMSSEEELRAAVQGAQSAGLPIVTTMSFDTNGRTMMGITPSAVRCADAQPSNRAGGDRRQLRRRRVRARGDDTRDHRGAARCDRGRQGELRHTAVSRRPYSLQRHAGAHGDLCADRARCRGPDHRRLLRHVGRASGGDAASAGDERKGGTALDRAGRGATRFGLRPCQGISMLPPRAGASAAGPAIRPRASSPRSGPRETRRLQPAYCNGQVRPGGLRPSP